MTNATPTPEPGAARQFWNAQMQRHPNLHGILSILGSIAQATGAALALRCFAGYSYALLELIYARIGKPSETVVSQQEHLKTVETLQAEHEERVAALHRQHQQALTALTEQHESRLAQLDVQQQQHLLAAVQDVENRTPAIDIEALTEAVTRKLEARFEAAMRQQITVTEAAHEAENTRQLEAPKKGREAKIPASRGGSQASTKVLTLRQRGAVPTEKRAAVYSLLDTNDRLSSYEIAEQTGYAPSTIQRYMKDWKVRQTEATENAM